MIPSIEDFRDRVIRCSCSFNWLVALVVNKVASRAFHGFKRLGAVSDLQMKFYGIRCQSTSQRQSAKYLDGRQEVQCGDNSSFLR
jgi:hypothetical protein